MKNHRTIAKISIFFGVALLMGSCASHLAKENKMEKMTSTRIETVSDNDTFDKYELPILSNQSTSEQREKVTEEEPTVRLELAHDYETRPVTYSKDAPFKVNSETGEKEYYAEPDWYLIGTKEYKQVEETLVKSTHVVPVDYESVSDNNKQKIK